ncbi:MAG: hypothetical protein HYU41_12950 [Candidatus Rokubacteria bacterium]|nr:hypothetical protein [Candidatus Rokubacteria bacterium]
MKKLLFGLCSLALVTTLATACTESGPDRLGERPADRDRTPAASPATKPPASSTAPSAPTTPTTPTPAPAEKPAQK